MILDEIAASVRQGVADRQQRLPARDLERLLNYHGVPRSFVSAIRGDCVQLIAEVKRSSPSKGWLRSDLNVEGLARSYARGGAAAISVLTEPDWFKGGLADLSAARQATHLPLLCKDFILDPYQVYEARSCGADAVLLITSLLSLSELDHLMRIAHDLGMAALVEVHSELEIERALSAKARLIGINNRNLADFTVDLETSLKLRPLIPADVTVVSESGIKSRADIDALQSAGIDAALVGETLVSTSDPEAKLKELRGEHQ